MNEAVIKTFLQKMVDQDNRATAFPFFYVIRTEVKDPAPLDNCDETMWYVQDSSYSSLDELKQSLKDNGYGKEDVEYIIKEAVEYGIKKRWEKRGMFLTETDAENHLKLNHYHYSSNAHTYVEHAWRAPELSEFFNSLLQHFKIEKETKHGSKT